MSTELELKIRHHRQMTEALKHLKREETILRREICQELFEGRVGEFKVTRNSDGVYSTAISRLVYQVDQEVLSSLLLDLAPDETDCFVFKASLRSTLYKKLPADSLAHQIITTKPGLPTLTSVLIEET